MCREIHELLRGELVGSGADLLSRPVRMQSDATANVYAVACRFHGDSVYALANNVGRVYVYRYGRNGDELTMKDGSYTQFAAVRAIGNDWYIGGDFYPKIVPRNDLPIYYANSKIRQGGGYVRSVRPRHKVVTASDNITTAIDDKASCGARALTGRGSPGPSPGSMKKWRAAARR